MTYDEHLAQVKADRLKAIKRKLNTARNALEDAVALIRVDHPEGGIFIDNGDSLNALSDTSVQERQSSILYHVSIEGEAWVWEAGRAFTLSRLRVLSSRFPIPICYASDHETPRLSPVLLSRQPRHALWLLWSLLQSAPCHAA